MHGGKQLRASFRIQRKQNTLECDCVGGTDCQKGCTKQSYNHYKSPYSVFTEPKISRPTRSCPAGPTNNQEKQQFNKFSTPLEIQATIHERSGSYENFSTAQLEQLCEDKQRESGKGSESWKKAVGQDPAERPQKQTQRQQTEQKRRRDMTLTEEIGKRMKRCQNRCGRHSITQYCHQQQPLSTSEYWSADPSPISENQPYFHHFRISPRVPPDVGEDEESSSVDGDNSSDDQEISPTALIQAWECQVRILTQELRACKGVAEKYRSKYLRLKARTEELNSELTREKERNSWLLNQLIATNDMMTQLSWAHLHFRDIQKHNFLKGADVADNEMRPPPNYPFGALLEDFEQPDKCERNARHRSAAGEVQAELSSDEFDDRATAIRKGLWAVEPTSLGGVGQRVESENGQQTINSKCKQQSPLRTPTPILVESANEHIRNQLHVEVARGSHLNSSRNSNSRLISPPFRTGMKKMVNNNSSEMIEEDNDEQLEEDEEDSENFIGTDPEEQDQQLVVIPLDAFCQQQQLGEEKGGRRAKGKRETRKLRGDQTLSVKLLLRHSRSSEDLRSTGKEFFGNGKRMVGSTMPSSSEDDIRMWKKQLRSRGERVLFRPSRKSLLSGAIGDGKGPRIFRRFGQREREALAKFDYLLDERTDLSGLMSSPEKLAETKTD
uniref:Uncharacterized protein n=1 Tax=Globodera rostochiensis TaxID=31243 RepID=A0A914H1H6_GLORO